MLDVILEKKILFFLTFLISFFVCQFILITKKYHIKKSAKGHSGHAVQSVHKTPTPRLGGVAFFLAIMFFCYFADVKEKNILLCLILSTSLIFVGGLADDFGIYTKPLGKLLISFFASVVMIFLTNIWLRDISTPLFQPLFELKVFAIFFTIFAATGISHSFNLIDGLNGLSTGIIMCISICMSYISFIYGDLTLSYILLGIFFSTLAVFIFNFPFGKIFFGDCGAYASGHLLGWISIMLVTRNPEISAWALLLCFFWPVMETIYSIYRRFIAKESTGEADLRHFHHLIFKTLVYRDSKVSRLKFTNSLSGFIIVSIASIPCVMSVFLISNTFLALFSIFLFSNFYIIFYRLLSKNINASKNLRF